MVGHRLKHYRIENRLGGGGMGEVYRALDTKLDRPVAIKILSAGLTGHPERQRRFMLEARATARLTHPAIAHVYEVDEVDGITFIAMEFVEGETVRRLIRNHELDFLGVLDIAIQAAEGLAVAHSAGIIHRDIKSANLMVTRDGRVKILDFGLAKLFDPLSPQDPTGANRSDLETVTGTEAGMIMGTAAYMSPEQAKGKPVDHRSDIFSFGITLYEMATGHLPFRRETPLDTMQAVAFDEAPSMLTLRHHIPPDLQRIVSRCLRKRPEDRFQDIGPLATDLKILKRDTEFGRVKAVTVRERIHEGMETLRGANRRDYLSYGLGLVAVALAVILLVSDISLGGLFAFIMLGLFCWRYLRNRPERILQSVVRTASKMPEIRVIQVQDTHVVILAEETPAALYRRVNYLVTTASKKFFFGKPLTVSIRETPDAAGMKQFLSESGIRYVHDDITHVDPRSSA